MNRLKKLFLAMSFLAFFTIEKSKAEITIDYPMAGAYFLVSCGIGALFQKYLGNAGLFFQTTEIEEPSTQQRNIKHWGAIPVMMAIFHQKYLTGV